MQQPFEAARSEVDRSYIRSNIEGNKLDYIDWKSITTEKNLLIIIERYANGTLYNV